MPTSLPAEMSARMTEIIQQRASLPREDLEYVVEAVAKLKDERLKACVAELIGWGDEERAELETFVAVAIEIMKTTNPSKVRNAMQTVALRTYMRDL
jgi:hypothetical protein